MARLGWLYRPKAQYHAYQQKSQFILVFLLSLLNGKLVINITLQLSKARVASSYLYIGRDCFYVNQHTVFLITIPDILDKIIYVTAAE